MSSSSRVTRFLFHSVLLTLPWIGLGVVRLVSGRDTGAGFQPAYVLLVFALPCAWLAARGEGRSSRRGWAAPIFLALAVVLVSLPGLWLSRGAVGIDQALLRFGKQLIQLVLMSGFVALPLLWLDRGDRWRDAARWLGAGMAIQLIYGIAQFVHFHLPLDWFAALERVFTSNPSILAGSEELYLGDSFTGIARLRGTACEPLYLGNYLLLVLPWLGLGGRGGGRLRLATAAACVLLLLTWSRGAWLAGGFALLVWAVLSRRSGCSFAMITRGRLAAAGLAAALVLAAAALIRWPAEFLMPWQRLLQSLDLSDWSNLTRFYSMQAAWRAFLLSPLVGVGWGQFGFHFPLLVDPTGLQSQFTWPVVNNFPLQILCETGLAGMGAAVAALVLICRRTWRAVSPDTRLGAALGPEGRRAAVLCATACAGVWFQLLTFSQYNLPHIWLALGLLLAATRITDQEAERGA